MFRGDPFSYPTTISLTTSDHWGPSGEYSKSISEGWYRHESKDRSKKSISDYPSPGSLTGVLLTDVIPTDQQVYYQWFKDPKSLEDTPGLVSLKVSRQVIPVNDLWSVPSTIMNRFKFHPRKFVCETLDDDTVSHLNPYRISLWVSIDKKTEQVREDTGLTSPLR